MSLKKYYFLLLFITSSIVTFAQSDSSWNKKPSIHFGGFADVYYGYDFNEPKQSKRQPFLFNHNRHNEFNINLALLQIAVDHEKYRAKIGLQSGTYAQDNYAAEASIYQSVYEASIGISLNNKNNLWLDAGLFPSNLGFESAISMDNMTLTRSLSAESSPYFLTGAKLTYNPTERLELAALVTNGWQRIERLEGNSLPAFGTQFTYKIADEITFNWSTFIGSEYPDSLRRMRYFNNFYTIMELSQNWHVIAGIDLGVEQLKKGSEQYKTWFVPTIIAQFIYNEKWKAAFRVEYIEDKEQIVISQKAKNGIGLWGSSINLDYSPTKNIVCRLEARYWGNNDNEINTIKSSTYTSYFIGSSLAVKFGD